MHTTRTPRQTRAVRHPCPSAASKSSLRPSGCPGAWLPPGLLHQHPRSCVLPSPSSSTEVQVLRGLLCRQVFTYLPSLTSFAQGPHPGSHVQSGETQGVESSPWGIAGQHVQGQSCVGPPSAPHHEGVPPTPPRRAAQGMAARDRGEKKTRWEENSPSAGRRREELGVYWGGVLGSHRGWGAQRRREHRPWTDASHRKPAPKRETSDVVSYLSLTSTQIWASLVGRDVQGLDSGQTHSEGVSGWGEGNSRDRAIRAGRGVGHPIWGSLRQPWVPSSAPMELRA